MKDVLKKIRKMMERMSRKSFLKVSEQTTEAFNSLSDDPSTEEICFAVDVLCALIQAAEEEKARLEGLKNPSEPGGI